MRSWFFILFLFGAWNLAYGQIRPVSLEVPLYFSVNAIIVSEPYAESVEVKGGFGGAWGLGLKLNPLKHLAIRTGIEFWKNHMEAEYFSEYSATPGGPFILVRVNEVGDYRYGGLYTTLFFESKAFFVGGGFQFSAVTAYKGRITARDGSAIIFEDNNATLPNLAVNNWQQGYILGMVGFRFGIKEKYFFKPTVAVGLPFVPLFDPGQGNEDFFLAGLWLRVGLITEFVLKDWGERRKSKERNEERETRPTMPSDRW